MLIFRGVFPYYLTKTEPDDNILDDYWEGGNLGQLDFHDGRGKKTPGTPKTLRSSVDLRGS